MSVIANGQAQRTQRAFSGAYLWLIVVVAGLAVVSFVRMVTGADEIDSVGSIRAAVLATCPILMAAVGGLWSERAGVVNIGLEGQMILGTWGAGYFTYYYGPWVGIAGAALLGLIGGLIHAVATVTFGVDHIVSGVAINLIGAGAAKFLAEAFFYGLKSDRGTGGIKQLTGLQNPPSFSVPYLSDALGSLAGKHWFVVSDIAGILGGLITGTSWVTVLVFALLGLTAWVLWRTKFGLRVRSCGENPVAAETLGVNVVLHKYIAVLVSGAMAGIGGGYLVLVTSSGFTTGQTGGRGFIGLAAMIFGNWRPGGILMGASMFGYTNSLPLRSNDTIHALLLLIAIGLVLLAGLRAYRKRMRPAALMAIFAGLFLSWWIATSSVPSDFTSMTPYVVTLLVLAFSAQRLRMPAADGRPYRKGAGEA
jgi:simple sugar transport system permease protein